MSEFRPITPDQIVAAEQLDQAQRSETSANLISLAHGILAITLPIITGALILARYEFNLLPQPDNSIQEIVLYTATLLEGLIFMYSATNHVTRKRELASLRDNRP